MHASVSSSVVQGRVAPGALAPSASAPCTSSAISVHHHHRWREACAAPPAAPQAAAVRHSPAGSAWASQHHLGRCQVLARATSLEHPEAPARPSGAASGAAGAPLCAAEPAVALAAGGGGDVAPGEVHGANSVGTPAPSTAQQQAPQHDHDSAAHARYTDLMARIALERLFQLDASSRGGNSSALRAAGVVDAAAALGCSTSGSASQDAAWRQLMVSPVEHAGVRAAAEDAVHQGHVLAVSTEEKPSQKARNQERSPDYFANVGDAIRTLREDIPELFQRDLNYSIYRDDIVFKDPRVAFDGIKNYKRLFWSLRASGRLFFSRIHVDVKRIWQPTDGVIKMRWCVIGVPRVPWDAENYFDGISTYKLDNNGKVYEHNVDNVLLRDPPALAATSPLLSSLNLAPSMQQPCPGACTASMDVQPEDQLPQVAPVLVPSHRLPQPSNPTTTTAPTAAASSSYLFTSSTWGHSRASGSARRSSRARSALLPPSVHAPHCTSTSAAAAAPAAQAQGAAARGSLPAMAAPSGATVMAGTAASAEVWAEAVRDVSLTFSATPALASGGHSAALTSPPRSHAAAAAVARQHGPAPSKRHAASSSRSSPQVVPAAAAAASCSALRPQQRAARGTRAAAAVAVSTVAAHGAVPAATPSAAPTAVATAHQHTKHLNHHNHHHYAASGGGSSGTSGGSAAGSWSQQLERLHEALAVGADVAVGSLHPQGHHHGGASSLEPSPSH